MPAALASAGGSPALPGKVNAADAAAIRACLLYKDEEILVLNKPAGLPVQGGTRAQVKNVARLLPALRERESTWWQP